jgi:hypothetical protein
VTCFLRPGFEYIVDFGFVVFTGELRTVLLLCWYHRVWGLIAIKGWVNSFGIFRDVLLGRKTEELQVL